ncbi:hypothetical protein CEXT_790761 [Caerostris extrusa]|uniref:Uncharacterized protein n=1 Tax=Caerostris extrusa TaxID=172846 RepID=A0AAV4VYM7_CAEEX|nr:hypothetical protein CEXT_790761 [Caerostris extrusa]
MWWIEKFPTQGNRIRSLSITAEPNRGSAGDRRCLPSAISFCELLFPGNGNAFPIRLNREIEKSGSVERTWDGVIIVQIEYHPVCRIQL